MTAVPVPPAEAELLERSARSFVAPGPTLDGARRAGLAHTSRAAAQSPEQPHQGDAQDPLGVLARRLTTAAHTIREADVADLEQRGIPVTTYVEVVGLVARLQAIDTFAFAVGAAPATLPEPLAGPPTGKIATDASIMGGWVPTVGPASPPSALSLLPDEHEAMHDLHGVFYLSVEGMADLDADRGLHRTQMELVASRTSLLNECFF